MWHNNLWTSLRNFGAPGAISTQPQHILTSIAYSVSCWINAVCCHKPRRELILFTSWKATAKSYCVSKTTNHKTSIVAWAEGIAFAKFVRPDKMMTFTFFAHVTHEKKSRHRRQNYFEYRRVSVSSEDITTPHSCSYFEPSRLVSDLLSRRVTCAWFGRTTCTVRATMSYISTWYYFLICIYIVR